MYPPNAAAFGVTVISDFLVAQQLWLRLVGGIFLCHLGLRTTLARVADRAAGLSSGGLLGAYRSTFGLTVTNPMTIISFAAVFAGLGLGGAGTGYGSARILVLGVFSGSGLWWLTLSGGVSRLRGRVIQSRLASVNRLSGAIVLAVGISASMSDLSY